MTDRKPGERPAHVRPPAHLSKNVPVPEPKATPAKRETDDRDGVDPTRYGDWVHKGIAVDF